MNDNLHKFINVVNQYVVNYYATELLTHAQEFKDSQCANKIIRATNGRKYIKLSSNDTVFAFVEAATGNIFKPATFATPAKGVRGNINSPTFGVESLNFVPGTSLVHIYYAK